jgi:thioredoxin reductase
VPRASSTFETTLPGLYVAGEVTGIALIHNAVAQGVQVAASALATTGPYDGDVDLAIIGAGPAGIAAALEAQRRGARCVVFEKGGFGGAMRSYPRQKVVMTAPLDLPGIGRVALRRTTKEALLELFESVVARARLPIVEHAEVTGIARTRTGLRVDTTAGDATARRVVLAIGRRGVPRKLAVPGDDLPHVVHAVADPAAHAGKRIVVVGGGDSAVELALALRAHRGTRVMLVHRGHDFGRAKPANQRALARAAERGRLLVHIDTRVYGVTPAHVVVAGPGFTGTLPAELVVCCLGAELPARWLRGLGVELRELRGEPLALGTV